jgi:hypothetical protein
MNLKHFTHGIHQLDTIILGGVVARRNHEPNSLTIEFTRPQRSQESNPKDDRIEQICLHAELKKNPISLIHVVVIGVEATEPPAYEGFQLTPAVPY